MGEIRTKQILPNWWRADRGKTYLGIIHFKDGAYRVVHKGAFIGEAEKFERAVKLLEPYHDRL